MRTLRTALVSLVAVTVPSCFVTIADPAAESKGGASGNGAAGGAGSGGSSDGNAGGHAGRDAGLDSSDGGGGGSGQCAACALPNVKEHGCADAACTIVRCAEGFVDCDGDANDGCEADFRVAATDAGSGALARKFNDTTTRVAADGDLTEWAGVPLYSIAVPCTTGSNCRTDQPGGQTGEPIAGEIPNAEDLTAVFGVGWDTSAIYAVTKVLDDQIVALDANDVERQDGIELLLDGNQNDVDPNYSPDVHHLFAGALAPPSANVAEKNQQLQPGDVAVAAKKAGRCYFVEVRLSWPYVMGNQAYSPKPGDHHGFTIAVNDWDVPFGSEAGAHPVRESQLFSVMPGPNYDYQTTGFGVVTLE